MAGNIDVHNSSLECDSNHRKVSYSDNRNIAVTFENDVLLSIDVASVPVINFVDFSDKFSNSLNGFNKLINIEKSNNSKNEVDFKYYEFKREEFYNAGDRCRVDITVQRISENEIMQRAKGQKTKNTNMKNLILKLKELKGIVTDH